jgi:hypothetical protein
MTRQHMASIGAGVMGSELTDFARIDPSFICMTGTPGDRPFPQGIS